MRSARRRGAACAHEAPPPRAAAVAVIWVKDPSGDGEFGVEQKGNWVSIISTTLVSVILLMTTYTMLQMFFRLHTQTPAKSTLNLKTSSCKNFAEVSEFYVGDSGATAEPAASRSSSANDVKRMQDERSKLLPFGKRSVSPR